MSFLENLQHRMQLLEMNDISDLCVLGFLFDDARNLTSLINVIRMLDIATWQPTVEVIEATVERLLDEGSVIKLETGNDTYFSITGAGIHQFFVLMKRPMPRTTPMRDTTLSLKSTFVELLPKPVCKTVVEELIGFYNCQLNCIENQCTDCPLKSRRGQMQNDRRLFQIQQELQWLGQVTRTLGASLSTTQAHA